MPPSRHVTRLIGRAQVAPFDIATDADASDIAARASGPISVEIVAPGQIVDLRDAWADLLNRADTPNVFMDPALLQAAAATDTNAASHTVLAWKHTGGRRQLTGQIGRAHV